MTTTSIDQPPPTPNDRQPSWEAAIVDLRKMAVAHRSFGREKLAASVEAAIELAQERDRVGRERYGTPLQPFNGRDNLLDAIAEAADLVVYLRNELTEVQTREGVSAAYLAGVRLGYGGALQGFVGLVGLLEVRRMVAGG